MLELLELLARILVGWFGVSFVLAGLWIAIAVSMRGRTALDMLFASGVVLLGAVLLWLAINPP